MKCEKKKCNALGDIENGHYNRNGQSFGDKATAVCNEGYVLRGERVRMCTEKGWNGTDPICEVSKIICSAPAVANRLIKPGERTQYAPQDTVSIVCSEGFELIGLPDVACGPDGQWQGLPECRFKVITCSDPTVAHGRITPGSGVYKHKDTVDVVCNDGFDLSGPAKVTCGPDGQWQALPECHPKKISGQFARVLLLSRVAVPETCPTPNLGKSGTVKEPKFDYVVGESMSVTCNEGFIGSGVFTCHANSKWHPNEPKCQLITCSDPTVAHGRITPGSGVYKHKDTVGVVCNDGFDLSGPAKVTCGPDGQWQALPECRPKKISGKCGPAPSHPHAFPRDPMRKEYPSGARLRYKCSVGYVRTGGSSSVQCLKGRWTKLQLQCGTVHCPPPPEVKGAEMSDPISDSVPLGYAVSYHCHTGALIGERDIYCTKSGSWSAPPPECKDIACPNPQVHGGSGMRGFRAVYKYGNTVTIACRPGLRLVGESFVTCGSDGKWRPKLPVCVK
ncbi:Sushi, von Willebrand factor type A, EGF and pentraxin domain-containing protein 1 [Labeo rohita]|uniref:Sushi, von Willebrand factor type A, EGF and pentraxin domain-containing protein 1 n=1 Tax=Labeo rohita TaxID=84645 RepID=A0ABQ8LHL4_LABRO|nr:Sushi, von Willebrand factor type A, EGF and pentraxin domain-containing protein 1 [Labeo rohita]